MATSGPTKTKKASGKVVYLTFDDGPSDWTPKVKKILDKEGVKATFFTVGEQVAEQPEMVRALAADGMSVQSHTWSHEDLTTLSAKAVAADLAKTSKAIESATGTSPNCVRPPYGARDEKVDAAVAATGLAEQLWTIDTEDWTKPGAKKIVKAVVKNVQSGSVILMHDGGEDRTQTLKALQVLIDKLKAKGYKFGVLCSG